MRIHKAKIQLELLEIELVHSKDSSLKFFIEMEELAIQKLLKPETKTDMYQAFVWINKQGISIEENKVSTFWFFKYIEFLTKEAKSQNKNNVVGK